MYMQFNAWHQQIQFIPHSGVPGNEKADEFDRAGVDTHLYGPEPDTLPNFGLPTVCDGIMVRIAKPHNFVG